MQFDPYVDLCSILAMADIFLVVVNVGHNF
jgi:hypothetical protein